MQDNLFETQILDKMDEEFKRKSKLSKNNERRRLQHLSKVSDPNEKVFSEIPAPMTRTSAFSPKSNKLNKDLNYFKTFVNEYSVVCVQGGELGTPHRDLIYALFMLKPYSIPVTDKDGEKYNIWKVDTTFRQLLTVLGKTIHKTNIRHIVSTLFDLNKISVIVWDKDSYQNIKGKLDKGVLPAGSISNLISSIEWEETTSLDSRIKVEFGKYTTKAFDVKELTAIDYSVYVSLNRDYAKGVWAFISGQKNYSFVTEYKIARLFDFNLFEATPRQKADFRRKIDLAFQEIRTKGGIDEYYRKKTSVQNSKLYNYYYSKGKYPNQLKFNFPRKGKND